MEKLLFDKLCDATFDKSIGETIHHIDENGIYFMDVANACGDYTIVPYPEEEFVNMLVKRLVEKLNKASDVYYNSGKETMTDYEYDQMYSLLQEVEIATDTVLDESPTKNVGAPVVTKLPVVKHKYPALSLDKTQDITEYCNFFINGNQKAKEKGNLEDDVVLMWKMDGSTIVATYENGKLQELSTRGNGEKGSLITHNAPFIKGLPMHINFKGSMIIRGEAVMSYKEFERINKDIPDEEKYKNARNLANASIQLYDSNKMRKREIQLKAFNLVELKDGDTNLMPASFEERLKFMKKMNISVVDYKKCSPEQLKEVMKQWTNRVKEYQFPVDGLVTVYNNSRYTDELKGTGKHPHKMGGYAFKWEDTKEKTILREIYWSPSRTGLLNPVAVFDPVELEGTTVRRASVHNLSYIMEKDLRIGDELNIYKKNMIIPQVAENLSQTTEREELPMGERIPVCCPVCSGKTAMKKGNDSISVVCENPYCPSKKIGAFVHFCERDCMDIKGMSEETITKFVERGFLKRYSDFYHLDRFKEDIISMDGFGEKSYLNIIKAVESSRNCDFISYIHSMGISNVGHGQAKLLKAYLEDIYEDKVEEGIFLEESGYSLIMLLMSLVHEGYDFCRIDGFGEVISNSLTEWVRNNLLDPYFLHLTAEEDTEITDLLDELSFTDEKVEEKGAKSLAGKTFVITGSLSTYKNRDELVAKIESLGGKVTGSVSKKTDYLINNDVTSASGKNKKAIELNIPILSEMEFNTML